MTQYEFTDLSGSGRRAIWATSAYACAQLGLSAAHVYQNAVIRRYISGTADDAALLQSDNVVGMTSIVFLLLLILVFIVNGRFIYLASRNAAVMTPDSQAITPGWAVGWFAVPIANFWMPYKAMKETWLRTFKTTDTVPGWFVIWWLSWVAMNIVDQVLGRMSPPNNLPDYIGYNQAFIVSGVLWLIPAYLFLRIIRILKEAKHNPAEVFA